jgi:hypothetical protein
MRLGRHPAGLPVGPRLTELGDVAPRSPHPQVGDVILAGKGDGGSTPPPGCYPAGTQCRGFIQHMVYCCPGGTTWSRQEGWCVGWWDALPCRPLG